MEEIKNRYVIRRVKEKDYYNGSDTFYYSSFGDFKRAKIFKNIAGAKVACLSLCFHAEHRVNQINLELEIVEVVTSTTDKIIKYIRP
jgi:hypothetical protein